MYKKITILFLSLVLIFLNIAPVLALEENVEPSIQNEMQADMAEKTSEKNKETSSAEDEKAESSEEDIDTITIDNRTQTEKEDDATYISMTLTCDEKFSYDKSDELKLNSITSIDELEKIEISEDDQLEPVLTISLENTDKIVKSMKDNFTVTFDIKSDSDLSQYDLYCLKEDGTYKKTDCTSVKKENWVISVSNELSSMFVFAKQQEPEEISEINDNETPDEETQEKEETKSAIGLTEEGAFPISLAIERIE